MTEIITTALEDAITSWQKLVAVEYPLFQLPVERAKGDPKAKQLWFFATDNRSIKAHLYKPREIDQIFEKVVARMYRSAYGQSNHKIQKFLAEVFGDKAKTEDFQKLLCFHNNFSLMLHEVFHPLYCPDSPEDQEAIYQALAKGIQKALPQTSAADLVTKIHNVENTIWDFCIDTFQYSFLSQNRSLASHLARELSKSGYALDHSAITHFPEGVIPIFDVVSQAPEKSIPTSVYALTRYTYSLLFCKDLETRKNLLGYFQKKIEAAGIRNLEQLVKESLQGLIREIPPSLLAEKKVNPKKFQQAVDHLYLHREDEQYDNAYLVTTSSSLLLDKLTRYDALCGFIQPLAHLISSQRYERRGGKSGSGSGSEQSGSGEGGSEQGSASSGQNPGSSGSGGSQSSGQGSSQGGTLSQVLQALLAGMTLEQANQFLQALAGGNNSEGNPHEAELRLMGADEYYKRNSPEILLRSQDKEAVTFDQGKMKRWVKDFSLKVPVDQLHRHQKWIDFGMEKNLPVFCELVPGQLFVVTYFRQEEIEIRSHDYQQKGIDIARNYILINDCSGTMGGGAPGSGSRWDGLEHVNYGVLKCLYRAGQLTQKEIDVWVAQFSNTTLLSGPFPLAPFYESPKGKGKETLLAYQGGNTILNPQIFPIIKKQLKPGRAVWSFVTDGDIYNADQVYPEIEKILKEPDQCVLFFEIFYKSSFGTKLRELSRRQKNLCYQSVDNIRQILDHSLEVLVQYEK